MTANLPSQLLAFDMILTQVLILMYFYREMVLKS